MIELSRMLARDQWVVEVADEPYRTCVVDNFLTRSVARAVCDAWLDPYDQAWFRGRPHIGGRPNVLERGMLAISDVAAMPDVVADVVTMLHSSECTAVLAWLVGDVSLQPDTTMRWSGMRTMLPGACQLVHSDARYNPSSRLGKRVTAMLYLNEGYDERDDGCLELWDDAVETCVRRIQPLFNRLVMFENSETSYHGVPCVNSRRDAVTFSMMGAPDTSGSMREKALFVPRPCDGPDVVELGSLRAALRDY